MSIELYQVDAFTEEPFSGNPAAVCMLTAPADPEWMQKIASEMNLSETAFIHRERDGYRLRWFTPSTEVKLCGHATLATAHVLRETGLLAPGGTAVFHTLSGRLTAETEGELIVLDFPADPVTETDAPPALADALGRAPSYVGKGSFGYLAEVDSAEALRGLKPDFTLLKTVPAAGVIVTSASDTAGFDFLSRCFAPASGIDEDPATGAAHCCLAPYWAKKLGRSELSAYQASRRGGSLRLRLKGGRVLLAGHAVTVFKVTLLV